MVLIYTSNITSRLEYIADTICNIIGIPSFQLTTDIDFYKNASKYKINYSSSTVVEDEFFIQASSLLNENRIQKQFIEPFEWNGLKAFYKTGGDIPFDIFAASFYLITRYEEYLPHQLDFYGRYDFKESIAYKQNFLHLPLVSLWMEELKRLLKQKFPSLELQSPAFRFYPTYDIDIAYSYKGKGWVRNLGRFSKEIIQGRMKDIMSRVSVYTGLKKDPFDVYEWLNWLHQKYKLTPIYFYLMAEETHFFDKNIIPYSKEMVELLLNHEKRKYEIGIHPSWQSGDNFIKLKKEIEFLKTVVGKNILLSRQHYIRMRFPHTYNILLDNGITHDYSMGYGSINGFRASVATPYYWYDLATESEKQLLVHPFCYMEANSHFEQHYSVEQAGEELQCYHDTVKAVNGELITIFHNHFLTEEPKWLPWRKMYEAFLRKNFG